MECELVRAKEGEHKLVAVEYLSKHLSGEELWFVLYT